MTLSYKFTFSSILYISILLVTCISCTKDDLDPLTGASENMTFTQLAAPSPFAAANSINVSENEKYMIISFQENTSVKHYYSTDGGKTVELFPVDFGFNNRSRLIDTPVSDLGEFLFDGAVYYLDNPSQSGTVYNVLAITQSGKYVNIQNDPALGKNAFFIYENGSFVSTGVAASIDVANFVGVSGEKLGFFVIGSKTVAEFDVSSKTFTEKQITTLNYNQISGNGLNANRVKRAYSKGHFAYAKEGGCLIISPEGNVTYYNYPSEYQIYLNTEGGLKLFGDKAYVNIYKNTGGVAVFEASGNEISATDYTFPIMRVGDNVYRNGFIENGSRLEGGVIKEENNQSEYLPLSFRESVMGKSFLVGDYIYYEDKAYDVNAETYSNSGIGTILNVYYDNNRTIAYTDKGTFTTTDKKVWSLKSEDGIKPTIMTKGNDGKYYGMVIVQYNYNPGATGFIIPQFNQVVYTSADGIVWEAIQGSNKSGLGGKGPRSISPDGTVMYSDNINPLGNQVIKYYLSTDYGVSYESLSADDLEEGFKVTEHITRNGRFVTSAFSFDGTLVINVCGSPNNDCKEVIVMPSFDSSGLYGTPVHTYTANDELLISTISGVYKSSPL